MKIKKISLLLLLILCVFVTGCGNEEEESTYPKQTIVGEGFDYNGSGTLKCTTEAYANEGIDVEINYTVLYQNGNILNLHSINKVISDEAESLDQYETAYRGIAAYYEDLKYYDTSIVRDENSVTYDVNINYEKIDIKKLLSIEGEEDNVVKNGKAKLSLWLALAEKVGTTCEEA